MEDNILRFVTDKGVEKVVSVLDIFKLEKYPNKEYIVYTFNNDEVEEDDKVCISELVEKEDSFTFKTIKDEEEWTEVQEFLKEMEFALSEGE